RTKHSRTASASGWRTSAAKYMKAMIARIRNVMMIGWSIRKALRRAGTSGVLRRCAAGGLTGGKVAGSSRVLGDAGDPAGRIDYARGSCGVVFRTPRIGTGTGSSPEPINDPRITVAIE